MEYESDRRAVDGDAAYRDHRSGRMGHPPRSGGGGNHNHHRRDHHHHQRPRGGRGGGKDYYGSGGGLDSGGRGPPTLLSRGGDKGGLMRNPGSISIMQRASSGGNMAATSPLKSNASSGSTSPSPGYIPTHPPQLMRPQYDRGDNKGRPQRSRSEGQGSTPSSFVPLQPTGPGGRGLRERGGGGGGDTLASPAGSSNRDPWSQTHEMLHAVKLVDKNMHWEDKGLDYLMEQSDFLVVGVVGRQGVGKSSIMSLLAGSRTGSGKPAVFRPETKEVWESESYQTTGLDMAVTPERVILLDTQPVLSEAMLTQFSDNPSLIPSSTSPDMYLEILSLQVALFLYTVCHVVVVVVDSMDHHDPIFKFLRTVEHMKLACFPHDMDNSTGDGNVYFPQLVFVFNHASPHDFQPLSLRQHHSQLMDLFTGTRANIEGNVSLVRSGLVQKGFGFPVHSTHTKSIDPAAINFHLLPTNSSSSDNGTNFSVNRYEQKNVGLNPLLCLLPSFTGHPSYQLLSETLRNQLFAMPRPSFKATPQPQFTEKEWYDFSRRTWVALKKSDLVRKYEHYLQSMPPE